MTYNEVSCNGFTLDDKYIPKELIMELLCWVDCKSLINCQLVCKSWNVLIQEYVWKRKAEMMIGYSLSAHRAAPWTMYCSLVYSILNKKFDQNLIKNHSGKDGLWNTLVNDDMCCWSIECPPYEAPNLPDDPVFKGESYCFLADDTDGVDIECSRYQIIDLLKEGFQNHLLDVLQPPIQVSEYYFIGCGFGVYKCQVDLLTQEDNVLDSYRFSMMLDEVEQQFQWSKFEHEFLDYGKGVSKVRFTHTGVSLDYDGIRMAGACVKIKLPTTNDKKQYG